MLKMDARERAVISLIGGQFIFFGIALAYVYVAANALFLTDFGSEMLAYVYVAVGVFVSLTFYGLSELQRRWPLSRIMLVTNAGLVIIFFLVRFLLSLPNSAWVSFALLTFFFFGVQLFFVSAGGQAGHLLDVRQMKRFFPLLVAATNIAFIIGNLSVSALLSVFERVENLLLVSGGMMLLVLAMAWLTIQRFKAELARPPEQGGQQAAKPLSQLIRQRYVTSIFSYQMLSAIGTQLALFLLITLADLRYDNADDLARFFGNFAAGRNTINVLFMLLLAGWLMSRFGLSFGLTANPVSVGVMVVLMTIVSITTGQGELLFWLAVATVALDVIFSESITSTSLKAVYQSLPAAERPVMETGVEGIGVPVAFGITGVLLIIFSAISGLTFTHIIFFTIFMAVLWGAAGFLVYRGYSNALLKTLSRRALGEVALSLDDESSLAVVENLLQSPKLREVCLGLDMLADAEHESLDAHLVKLVGHPDARIRAESLARLEQRRVEAALPAVETRLQVESDPTAKGAALRTLCALQEVEAVERVTPYLDDPEADVRLGALVGLLHYGGIPGVLAAGERIANLEYAPDPAERSLVARVIGQVGMQNFYQPLLSLLGDENREVRQAALKAAGRVNHPHLLPLLIDNLGQPATRSAAMAALVSSGEAILPLTARALAGETDYDEETVVRLVRVCGQIKGEQVVALLKQHLNHPDDDVQYQVLFALDQCDYRAEPDDLAEIDRTLRGEVEHGLRVLFVKEDIGDDESLTHLHEALDYEFEQVHRRVFLLLSFVYDSRAILRAEEQLVGGSKGEQAMALETLDVTLTGEQKALVFPLVDHSKPLVERARQLDKLFTLRHISRHQRLNEIITDPEGVWTHGWTRACAIYAAAKLGVAGSAEVVEEALAIREHPIRETAAWALHRLAPERYQAYTVELAADVNPQVAELAAHLAA